ncbi:protein-export membrane protein SecF [Candidatus Gottesmanbacteria bacterium RIFCSPHIGHO2_02_FULL_40_13]|uniref:Protein-export membrane protein SecF n=1 Tax=Candidatus Gottesmanbacteria bacterium RIFCSPHIGHO2_02_FULL_40_13 TaxID=1798384 RepID=A0A1F6ABM5_9BACT|nr:MAG: protein-export membrane protein SecF [Candidatus Gottesmanbacteria bacterium RIFCSPHIGHO2_02_FULL_40_13]
MIDIIGKKWWFLIFSAVIIIPGLISLILWGIRPAIDFTGGTLLEFQFLNKETKIENSDLRRELEKEELEIGSIQQSGENTFLVRLKSLEKDKSLKLFSGFSATYGEIKQIRSETVGPLIGQETAQNSLKAIVVASIAIIIYVALAFRHIPKPYSSWRFGICAVFALIHDILVVVGIFSILGHFYKVEIDSLFITALLTVMGFSVHDSIVVFDRIRENLIHLTGKEFSQIVNESIVQTLARSLSTSMTVILTLVALLLFGGESTRWFIAALLIGIISGTYSSIFNAAPLLVIWEERSRKKRKL